MILGTFNTRPGHPVKTVACFEASRSFGCLGLAMMSVFFLTANRAATAAPPPHEQTVDIVIAGAGVGGTAAAIQAARMGASVALVEETDWIGGQMSAAGVATMDEGGSITFKSGLYAEFLERMQNYYRARGKSVGTCYWKDTSHCYEPSAIQKVLYQMVEDADRAGKGHIDVYLREKIQKVLGSEESVTGVATQDRIFHSKIVIDATEYGDVLPLTHAAYRVGRFTSENIGTSCIQDINYSAIIKKYPSGVPRELRMEHAPPGYDAQFVDSMRRFLRADGNPLDQNIPVNFEVHNRLRALPDSSNPENYTASTPEKITRTAVNWFNDSPADTNIFDRSKRMAIECAAKIRTLDFIYYIQHDLDGRDWSVANDEGYNTPYNREENSCPEIPAEFKAIEANFPVMPYVRESRRIVGEYTLVGSDLLREVPWPEPKPMYDEDPVGIDKDAIAVGDYNVYFHDCFAADDLEPALDRESDMPNQFRKGPFQVPIEALIPEKTDGLLAAEKNISESRMASTATRLQPIAMLTGQAAGALAAISVFENRPPRKVDPAAVQKALLASNDGLAKQEFQDLPRNTEAWRSAEFAAVRGWLSTSGAGFDPDKTLTRAEAAGVLVNAFHLLPVKTEPDRRWWTAAAEKATYSDVPVYSPESATVEALVQAHAVGPCSAANDRFCPDAVETEQDFARSVQALLRRQGRGGASAQAGSATPLSRIAAAKLLYVSLTPQI
jgi:FAD dependent oxidoreductase